MADNSTPFLSQPKENNLAESAPPELTKHLPSLDSTIEKCIGSFGRAQLFQATLVSLAWLFDAQQTFITIFTDTEPTWHCTQLGNSSCNSISNLCQLSKDSWTWDFPKHTSTVSEWNIQCSGSIVNGLPTSLFFLGCLMGGLVLATLADSLLGRKNLLFLSCFVMSISTFFTTFSNNIWVYSALRFVTGFARATIGTCALVLSTELVGKRWRGQVGVIGFFCFTLGFLSLPTIAYINKGSSWRTIYLWTSIPTFFYSIIVHFLVHESPRWLLVQGRKEEAIQTLKGINNNSTMSFSSIPLLKQETWNVDLFSTIKILVKKKWAFKRLSNVMAIGFGIGMVYYGMPLALGNLTFNLYLSVTFNALSELPSSIATLYLVDKLNRKSSILAFTMISGIFSVVSILKVKLWKNLQIGFELISFFSACTAFNVLLIYTLELFPTCVRNSALSMVRQALVFGGIFSPMLAVAGRGGDGFWSYGIFGIVIGIFGLFVVFLPETRGKPICDTMDEEENKLILGNGFASC